jgi:hypothetical protein
VRRDREREPHLHPAGIPLDRRINEPINPGEVHYFVKFTCDVGFGHPKDRPIQEDIFSSRKFRVKTCAHFQETRDAPADHCTTAGRFRDSRQDFQQCGFASAIPADHSQYFPLGNLERNILERPQDVICFCIRFPKPGQGGQTAKIAFWLANDINNTADERIRSLFSDPNPVPFRKIINFYGEITQIQSHHISKRALRSSEKECPAN